MGNLFIETSNQQKRLLDSNLTETEKAHVRFLMKELSGVPVLVRLWITKFLTEDLCSDFEELLK